MLSHTRAMVAAAAYAVTTRTKVAGLYDHSTARELRIAAESRGNQVQGMDGDRAVKFGGTLPEVYDAGDKTFVSFDVAGQEVQGFDRGSGTAYVARVSEMRVQLYDHGESQWFTFDVRDVNAPGGPSADQNATAV